MTSIQSSAILPIRKVYKVVLLQYTLRRAIMSGSSDRSSDYDRGYEDGKNDSQSNKGDDHPPFFFTDFGRCNESSDHAPFFPW